MNIHFVFVPVDQFAFWPPGQALDVPTVETPADQPRAGPEVPKYLHNNTTNDESQRNTNNLQI